LPNVSFRGCARGGENCGQLFRFVNEIHHSFAKCSLSSFASLANLCMPRDYELLKLLTANAAKKFRKVRKEQRVPPTVGGTPALLSSAVVCAGLGMNQHAKKFGGGLFEADFEVGLDVVDAGEREIVGEGAVAGDVEASADFFDLDVVHVENFGEFGCEGFELAFEVGVADKFVTGFDGGGFAFDVREDVVDFWDITAHVRFELGDAIVGGF
jgi:hypothetical protein